MVFVLAQIRRVGAHQRVVLEGIEQHGHLVGVADGAARGLHAHDQPVAWIYVHHLELKVGHASTHLPGPSSRLVCNLTCDSASAVGSPACTWPHGQPLVCACVTNICCTLCGCAPPLAGCVLAESHIGQTMTRKL